MSRDAVGSPWSSETTKQYITAARGGSAAALRTIATSIKRIPPEHLLDIAEVFYPTIHVPDGFDPLAPLPDSLKPQYEKIETCLEGIVIVGELFAKRNGFGFKASLSAAWPNILKWAHFYFIDHSDPKVKPTLGGRASSFPGYKALALLAALFGVFGSIKRGYSNPSTYREDTFTLLAKLWLRLVPDPEMNKYGGSYQIMHEMRCALLEVYKSKTWFLSSAREIVLREANNQSSVVAKVALTALQDLKSFDSGDFSQKNLVNSISVCVLLLALDKPGEPTSVFHKALIDEGLVKITMRTLTHFTISPNNSLEFSPWIAGECFKVVYAILGAKSADILAPQILKYGLLDRAAVYVELFCSSGKAPLESSSFDVLKSLLERRLPNLLIHYSVISSAIKATNSLIRSKKITNLSTGVVSSEWKFFMDLLLERAAVKAHYELTLKKKDHHVCHNCGLSRNLENKKLLACSGCKLAMYCSPDCQKKAWNSETLNHRLECKGLMERMSDSDKYFNHHSTYFIPHLVGYDFKRHLPGIQKLIAESPEFRNAGSDLAYSMSYLKDDQEPEKMISLFRISRIGNEERFRNTINPESGEEKLKYMLKKAETIESRGFRLMHVKYFRGASHPESVFMSTLKGTFEMSIDAPLVSPLGQTNPRRRKARDEKGRELDTMWDIIDYTMATALEEDEKAQGSMESDTDAQVTVFDRIVKVAKDYMAIWDFGMAFMSSLRQ